jgi:hypothetical protein
METPMSESKTAEPLAERIALVLAERRPSPSSDFEARLERATDRAHRSLTTGLLAAAVAVCAILIVVVVRRDSAFRAVSPEPQPPPGTTPAPALPHDGRYSTNQCNQCHRPAPPPLTSHQLNGKFPLVGGHASVACASCHAAGKTPKRECSSCHTDPHRGARGTACAACHPPGSWKSK